MLPVIDSAHRRPARGGRGRRAREGRVTRKLSTRRSPPARRHRTAYRGLEVLTVYVQARRDLLFDRFLAFWREQEEAGTWDRLERTVARRLHEIKERRRAEERIENAQRELEAAERKERAAAERARQAAAELAAARSSEDPPEPASGLQEAV